MIVRDKTKLTHWFSWFVPILMIILTFIFTYIQDKILIDGTKLFVNINNWEFNRKKLIEGIYLYVFKLLFPLYLSHNNVTFLPMVLYVVSVHYCFYVPIPFQFYVFNNFLVFTMQQHKILVTAPNFVTLPSSLFTKVLILF